MQSKLNTKLLSEFTEETNLIPTYTKDGSTYHTLRYVNWLETKVESLPTSTNNESTQLTDCPECGDKTIMLPYCNECNKTWDI